ncbi:transcription-repair coupling factor [Candidatus Persebacteraceae bacterium Df01]|uniref:Transcription-repair-coupling factor n=1 Tax=Candidatus Doriopsillibacter californiensis TaxID=2970740 RepID=A0ABT7QJF6_9GAMM|nr:transcription-repair coupling factor [Candidatus Persebacteraceae bacterium Df01]
MLTRDSISAAHTVEELAFFAPTLPARLLPDWGCLPYDRVSPTADTAGARLAALAALHESPRGIIVAAATTMLLPCPPPAFVLARTFNLQVGARLDISSLIRNLTQNGYARADRVLAAGEFAVYGGQLDIFPPDSETPFRLVLLDDEIEQIRLFDPQTQRSTGKTDTIRILPSGECDLSAAGVSRFREAYVKHFGATKSPIYEHVSNGERAPGIEFMLPLFFDNTATALDYPSANTGIVLHHDCHTAIERFMHQARRRQKLASVYENRTVLPVKEVFVSPEDFYAALRCFSVLEINNDSENLQAPPPVAINHRRADSHTPLINFLRESKQQVIIATDSEGRRQTLQAALTDSDLRLRVADSFSDCRPEDISLVTAPLRGGFMDTDRLCVLTEAEVFDVRPPPRAIRQQARDVIHVGELTVNGMVVHRDYGVGRYLGLTQKTIGNVTEEFLEIEYADSQRLWLPVPQLNLLSPHHGEITALSKLGSNGWKRARAKAEKNARDTAARLLEIHARRAAKDGNVHAPDEQALARFADGFNYEETPDQAKAVREVLEDMRAEKTMDRLVAADVGFGKTEVAMRAACACALSGGQTAVLAPTTLLAEQHARTFTDRFSGFPVRIASLTRLAGSSEKKTLLHDIADGSINIVIGTHALLSPAVNFHQLNLVVIDEEHRFGVRQKEHFKALRADVDILSLSATPIPRTMAMAMDGLRDISIITTPPPSRLTVHTTVAPFSHGLIVDACERELFRGGQIYFVHNEIRTLSGIADQLREWLPEARLVIAHGSMGGLAMEQAMRRFLRHESDILLCTTIVESGLDIANANTIIINRADRMGLSRLHQLRGRVGRGGAQAYALLLTPPEGAATKQGDARLEALTQYESLGGGFFIAMRDLEIRGAGEILGERQSGDINAVGCSMYQKMVNDAVRQLRGDEIAVHIDSVIDLNTSALLPPDYVRSPHERLRYYHRLSNCENLAAINDVQLEWEDRFGIAPPPARRLITCHRLRLLAGAVEITRLQVMREKTARLEFADNPRCLNQLMAKIAAKECRLATDSKSVIIENLNVEPDERAIQLADFLRDLSTTHTIKNK